MMEARACAWLVVLGLESAALSLGPGKKDEESAKSPGPLSSGACPLVGAHTRRMLAQGLLEGNQGHLIQPKHSGTCAYQVKRISPRPNMIGHQLSPRHRKSSRPNVTH